MYKGQKAICSILLIGILCGCSLRANVNTAHSDDPYYAEHEYTESYETYIFGNGKYSIQLPEDSIFIDNSIHGLNNVYCILSGGQYETLSIGYAEAIDNAPYYNAEEIEKEFADSGVHLNGSITSFEAVYEDNEYLGYQYMIDAGGQNRTYIGMRFINGISFGFSSSPIDPESSSIDTINTCIKTLQVI